MTKMSSLDTTSGDKESLSEAVIYALAEYEGVDPMELDPLYDVIDPNALDELFRDPTAQSGRVVFSYNGYDVEVRSDGGVQISDSSVTGPVA